MTQEVEISMFKWKTIAAFAFAATVGASAYAANPFSDVPRTHWAYESIQKAVDNGILQGYEGKFHGDKLVNRYQMAVIVKKILDTVGSKGGTAGAGMKADDIKNLEQLTIEFADELALLNTKVSTLEDSFVQLRGEVDKLKGGSGASSGAGLTNAFTGMVSVALVSTDDGGAGTPPVGGFGGPIRTRYVAGAPDQTFFTIPQASIALDKEVGEGIGLHVQYDYGTNLVGGALDGNAGAGGAGTPVGLNEAYLLVDEIFGDIGAKIGGFALPFQSWEVNGPFRTCNYTITPSAINTAFEVSRVVGLEVSKMKDVDPADFQWRLGIFNGSDTALAPGNIAFGGLNDVAGMAGLSNSNTFDDSFGFYLDLESGNDPDKSWGWRLGFFDMGGDVGAAVPPPGAPPPSNEIDGFNVGFWWKNDDFRVMLQYMSADSEGGTGPGTTTDVDSWYILVNYQMNEDSSLTLRYDDWENEIDTPGIATGTEGDSFTFAYNRKTSDTSMFQFEWLSPDEEALNVVGTGDIDDDVIQLRYKVWF
jgi:hypothetical protein